MDERHVVTVFLKNNGTVLILRRSRKAGVHKGKWSSVSGTVQESSPLGQAMKEIETGTGLKGVEVKFLKAGREFSIRDRQQGICWIIHPFLFQAMAPQNVAIDSEHSEFKWIRPSDIELFETVPALEKALSSVL